MMNGSLTDSAVLAEGLVKSYGKVKALGGVSLDVRHGETFGIIGPDGAGKSTLFRLLTSLLVPDSGSAQVEGLDTVKDYREIRKIIGYMPGKFSLYQDLTLLPHLPHRRFLRPAYRRSFLLRRLYPELSARPV